MSSYKSLVATGCSGFLVIHNLTHNSVSQHDTTSPLLVTFSVEHRFHSVLGELIVLNSCVVFGVGSCPNLVVSESGYHLAMCSFH